MAHELVFIFPGQGSQSKGMLDAFAGEQVVEHTLQEASEALGYDMAALIRDDAEQTLDQTRYTQPALLTASVAMLRLWQQQGGAQAAQVLGHSLGEYSALVAAGSLDFSDAVQLVAFRGQVMSEAVAPGLGRMAAILGLDDDVVEELCQECSTEDERVWPANYNCPGQIVVAGHAAAVVRLMEAAKARGARRALPLAVSAPSHTPLMQPAADAMAGKLDEIPLLDPQCPVWSNADACAYRRADEIRPALVRQLVAPVRWTESIQKLASGSDVALVEMGPGKVLNGLVRRIAKAVPVYATASPDGIMSAIDAVRGE